MFHIRVAIVSRFNIASRKSIPASFIKIGVKNNQYMITFSENLYVFIKKLNLKKNSQSS